ncbi:PilT/PilU family type 4a pilus ATPase [Nocardioides dongxiaopingii]|uniref:type IV pilus twitching motility protein PilT n=1 Tax=Nocardioides sp. S-1144 TaxID=2582905 RepID=UPI00110D6078|nr:PilT/PilU family type 4a pilus ATPase [Nocardioides sp. S-1144]QCW51817.1 PilT/PilU family type 4a pilus ATPase [Nocardioides sp. S-1144]
MPEPIAAVPHEPDHHVVDPRAREFLHSLFELVVSREASDLHLRPGAVAKIRVDGALEDATTAPLDASLVSAMVAASMSAATRREFLQDYEADFAVVVDGVGRFRANAFRTRGDDGIILRRVRDSPIPLAELNMPASVHELARKQRGLVLVTGPTGSGKSTTLAGMVDLINRERACHILALEDPIEFMHADRVATVTQRELGSDTRSWPNALRAAMRQDPDVILIGELRDKDTVHAAMTAAETGHLVLGSMHTNDARETVHRLIEFFPAEEQQRVRAVLAGSLEGVVCQRLVPRIDGGRVCVMEVAVRDGRFSEAIADPEKTQAIPSILASGEYSGMQTFDQHLFTLVTTGVLDEETARTTASKPHDLAVMLRRAGWNPVAV